MKRQKYAAILFSAIFILFILLLSYKIALAVTPKTPAQNRVLEFIGGKGDLPTTYNLSEVSHLEDVKFVMRTANLVFYILLLAITATGTYFKKRKDILYPLLWYGGMASLSATLLLLLGIILSFNLSFTLFHLVFFPQGNWAFPAESLLIQTFPLSFFIYISATIAVTAIILSIISVVAARKLFYTPSIS